MTKEELNKLVMEHMGDIPMHNGEYDLTSISILGLFDLIYALETEANIVIPVEKICPENFRTLEHIYQLIQQ